MGPSSGTWRCSAAALAESLQERDRTVVTNILIADQERIFTDALAIRLDDEDDIRVTSAIQLDAGSSWLLSGKAAEVGPKLSHTQSSTLPPM